jgi:peptide chain release factor 1
VTFRATGNRAAHTFRNEAGGHRWQRVPPNDRRGRVQTSTITVAVLYEPTPTELTIDPDDLEWSTCRSGKAGGQHMQKTESAFQVIHLPSGLRVRCESERSQHQNRERALSVLRARLHAAAAATAADERNASRRGQIGSGQRGDKRRTIRSQDGTVTDHVLNVRMSLRPYLRGDLGPIVD